MHRTFHIANLDGLIILIFFIEINCDIVDPLGGWVGRRKFMLTSHSQDLDVIDQFSHIFFGLFMPASFVDFFNFTQVFS